MEQSKLSQQAEQLRAMVRDWIPKRKASVHTLRALADELREHHYNVQIAKVAGTSASVAGTVVAGVGFGLSFVTFGASLILSAVGLGVGAAGGAANAGTMIAEACIQKGTFNTAQKIIDDDREATEAIAKLLKVFETEAKNYYKKWIEGRSCGCFRCEELCGDRREIWSQDRWHCSQRRQRSFVSRSQCSRQGRSHWRLRSQRYSPTSRLVHFGNLLDRNRCSLVPMTDLNSR